ncbi:glycosyltransferase family 4 protein [Seonamhaeicola sp. MEBiC1930]|uniref:glycosyltransferase family 4 protein n=1 Tax=Seonamhaeicola sp. MEBiC01930 TaxID=2976768 RepID=UPI003253FE35
MKILFVHNNYGSNNSGEEHASQGLADLLESNNHTVEWFRKSSDVIQDSFLMKILAFCSGIYNPRAVRELKIKILEFKPDIIQVQNVYPFISPAILKMINRLNIPVVMRCPNYRLFCPTGLHLDEKNEVCEKCLKGLKELNAVIKNCEKSRFKSLGYALRNFCARTLWKLPKNMDAYIVQSDFQKNKFIENGIPSSKLFVIPGLTPALKTNEIIDVGEYVSFIGRASTEKGIVEFIEVATALPMLNFAVVGAVDPSLEDLKKVSPSNVLWTGFLSGKEYDSFYQKSKIVVVPSKWYEGFPNVITRAMQHGKPVITSNIGAMQSIIEHDINGLLVEPGNTVQLKNAIENLYKDDLKCKKMGLMGKEKAKVAYNDTIIYKELMNVYKFIIKK